MGDVEFSAAEITCPTHEGACFLCVNDVDDPGDHRLMIAVGQSIPAEPVWAFLEGVVRPFVEIDGHRVDPVLLPSEAFFRSGFKWLDRIAPPHCEGTAPHVTYAFGDVPPTTVSGDGEILVDLPASTGSEIPFHISLCSHFAYWGAGCGVGGSSPRRWRLHLPAPLDAAVIPAGDAPPVSFVESELTLDFLTGPGGTITATHAPGMAPAGPGYIGVEGYWETRGTMAPETFEAELVLSADLAGGSGDGDPEDLVIAVLNETTGQWQALDTTIDIPGGTASASTDRLGLVVLASGFTVPVADASWSKIKAVFR
jgi:hypothetical protein